MSRILERDTASIAFTEEEASNGRTTARSLATAIALLLVSILVVTRSRSALQPVDAVADASLRAGSVELSDDDLGTSLFAIDDMVPDRPERDCIVVSYRGNVLPVLVRLSTEAEGALADLLDVKVERGTGGSFQDCTGFAPTDSVFTGTLARLAAQPRGVEAFSIRAAPAEETFRFTFTLREAARLTDLADSGPAGADPASASARFVWTADPFEDSGN